MDGSLDETRSASRNNARKDRFGQPSNAKARLDALEAARTIERERFERQGLINIGQTELDDAVDMRGTCETMCCEYEQAKRVFTLNVNPLERDEKGDADPDKMVAIYTRSDAGAGVGEAMKLPSDLRTPKALVRSLDYLISHVMPTPSSYSNKPPSARRSLGNTAGFIRDRTRAIRKEFSLQSSWGHREAIDCLERIARYHILSLRELQEESGGNTDMHIDNAELGRCFTSLRQHYDDMRETTRDEMPCPNEPELRAYMLIYDLNIKSIAISTSELPYPIFSHPLVTLAFQIRQAAQRNFDSQKEGSKHNAELGLNLITRVVKLLRRPDCPFLLSCMAEIRLREVRRSALRALCQVYLPLRSGPLLIRDGEVVEKRMFGLKAFEALMGCEPAEMEESAWDDVDALQDKEEGVSIAKRFGLEPFPTDGPAEGILVHKGVPFDDNEDAPYTRRWAAITARRQGLDFADIVDGKAGVNMQGSAFGFKPTSRPVPIAPAPKPISNGFSFGSKPSSTATTPPAPAAKAIHSFFAPPTTTAPSFSPIIPATTAPKEAPKPTFSFRPAAAAPVQPTQPSSAPAAPTPTPIVPATAPSVQTEVPKPLFSFAPTLPSAPAPTVVPPVKPPAAIPSFFAPPPAESTNLSSTVPLPPSIPASTSIPSPSIAQKPAEPIKPAAPRINRHDRLVAASGIRSAIVESVLSTIIERYQPDLQRVINIELGVRSHRAAEKAREEAKASMARQVYRDQLADIAEDIAEEALLEELKLRLYARNVANKWRVKARAKAEYKRSRQKEEEETFSRLSRMGIGGVVRATTLDDLEDISYTPRSGPVLLPRRMNGYTHSVTESVTSSKPGRSKRDTNAMTWDFPPDLAVLFGVFEVVNPAPLHTAQLDKQSSPAKGSAFGITPSSFNGSTVSSRGTKRDRASLDRSALVDNVFLVNGAVEEVEEVRESRSAKSARLEEAIKAANACMSV